MTATDLQADIPGQWETQVRFAEESTPLKKRVSAAELCCVPVVFFPALWLVAPNIQTGSFGSLYIAGLVMLLVYAAYVSPILIHKDRMAAMGLGSARTLFIRTDNLGPALRQYGIVLLAGGLLIIVAALNERPHLFAELNWRAFFLKLVFYLFSGTVQGLLLSTCLLRLKTIIPLDMAQAGSKLRSLDVMRNRCIVSMSYALLFSVCHLPNAPLMIATLVYGFIAAWIFYATPNLVVAACCHAGLGTLLHRIYELNMRIGPFYYDSELHVFRTVFPFIGRMIGQMY